MWLRNILRVGRFRRRLAVCRQYLNRQSPDLVVPVDFGGFNLCLCKVAAARHIPVFYYIPPQVWAHGRYRLKKLRKWVTRAGLIYPFEENLYARCGVEAAYLGHPLFDELDRNPPAQRTVAELRRRFGEGLIGVFPGSRRQEVIAHLPVIVESCRHIRHVLPDVSFAVLGGPNVSDVLSGILARSSEQLEVLENVRPTELARASKLCLTKSGTITLEVASQGTPMVIFYRASPLVAFLAYGLSETPYIGLVNILAGRVICPERATSGDCGGWIAEQALRLLQDADAYEGCRQAIRRTLSGFAQPGASARAARSALSLV
jgi:lipid-A-disaccharide synthase